MTLLETRLPATSVVAVALQLALQQRLNSRWPAPLATMPYLTPSVALLLTPSPPSVLILRMSLLSANPVLMTHPPLRLPVSLLLTHVALVLSLPLPALYTLSLLMVALFRPRALSCNLPPLALVLCLLAPLTSMELTTPLPLMNLTLTHPLLPVTLLPPLHPFTPLAKMSGSVMRLAPGSPRVSSPHTQTTHHTPLTP